MPHRGIGWIVLGMLLATPVAQAAHEDADQARALRLKGLEYGYNLDYPDALSAFQQSIAAAPDHPAGYRMAAAAAWMMILFDQGHISVDDYFGDTRIYQPRGVLNAALEAEFEKEIQPAIDLAEREVARHPNSADAHNQLGAAYGLLASYRTTVRGEVMRSLSPARRAYGEQSRVLALDPTRVDAGITLGMYRYAVAGLSAPQRLVAHLFGFPGDRPLAIRLLEAAAHYPSDAQPNAWFTLILMYNGESRFDESLALITAIERRYPRNRLIWLEHGRTLLRQQRYRDALVAIDRGLDAFAHDARPKAPGEEARWRLTRGAALVGIGDSSALSELERAWPLATRDWVRGRIKLEHAKASLTARNRVQASADVVEARALCTRDHDLECIADAQRVRQEVSR